MNFKKFLRNSFLIMFIVVLSLAVYTYRQDNIKNNETIAEDGKLKKEEIKTVKADIELESLNNEIPEEEVELIEESNISILAVGDIMYHMPQVRAAYNSQTGTYDFTNNFKYLKTYLEDVDISIANYETTAAGKEHGYSGYPAFNSPVETLDSIKDAGFNIVNLSNNHILDKGKTGLLNTVENSKARGLKVIGASNPEEEKFLIEEIDNIKLGFLSYSYGFNGHEAAFTDEELASIVNIIDREKIKADIDKIKDQVDFVIVYIHWGEEYMLQVGDSQKALAQDIFEWGGDIILGSHPHVIQGGKFKEVNGERKYVIYSMGNFISNQRTETIQKPHTEDGVMVKLDLKKDSHGKSSIVDVRYIPTWNYKYRTDRDHYEIIPIEDALEGKIEIHNIETVRHRLEESLARTEKQINSLD